MKRQDNKQYDPFRKICPELWLMLASADADVTKTQNLLHEPINWDLLLQMAVHHRVYPLVYKTLNQINNPSIPKHVLDVLQLKYQVNVMQALDITGETIRMVNCFESHGIHVVVLKGAPLAWRLYGDIAIRPSRDIDILIPSEELEKAIKILEDEGYCNEIPENIMTSRQLQIFFKSNHNYCRHFGYLHSKKKILLELHWKLGYGLPMPTERNIKKIEVFGNPIPVLTDDEWLLFLISHGAGHAWFRLRWLVDIAKFMQYDGIDWERIVFIAGMAGMQSILNQALIVANQLLAVSVPPICLSSMNHDQLAWRLTSMAMNICLANLNNEIKESNDEYINHLTKIYNAQLRIGWKTKFKYVLHFLDPHINDIKFISLPDSLYSLYYMIRPFTWFIRYLQK